MLLRFEILVLQQGGVLVERECRGHVVWARRRPFIFATRTRGGLGAIHRYSSSSGFLVAREGSLPMASKTVVNSSVTFSRSFI